MTNKVIRKGGRISILKKHKMILFSLIVVTVLCSGLYAIANHVMQNNILLAAAIYPPNIFTESHHFVVKKNGTMEIVMGRRDEEVSITRIVNDVFIIEPLEKASLKLSAEDIDSLTRLVEKLDALGIQSEKKYVDQIGGYVAAVYYNGVMLEFSCIDPELDPWHALHNPEPLEVRLADEIINFLLDRSPIPLNEDAWWF